MGQAKGYYKTMRKNVALPGRVHSFRDARLNDELDRLWRFAGASQMYPLWRFFTDDNKVLYLQYYNASIKKFESRLKLDTVGNMTLEGTSTPSTDVENTE